MIDLLFMVEPIYKELQLVHEDYMESWRGVALMLNGSDDPGELRGRMKGRNRFWLRPVLRPVGLTSCAPGI